MFDTFIVGIVQWDNWSSFRELKENYLTFKQKSTKWNLPVCLGMTFLEEKHSLTKNNPQLFLPPKKTTNQKKKLHNIYNKCRYLNEEMGIVRNNVTYVRIINSDVQFVTVHKMGISFETHTIFLFFSSKSWFISFIHNVVLNSIKVEWKLTFPSYEVGCLISLAMF